MADTPNVRRVSIEDEWDDLEPGVKISQVFDSSDGTHALVPWETWKLMTHAIRFLMFVTGDSSGIAGYHYERIATWEEFEEFSEIEDNRRVLEEIGGEDG
jgi:hypothetical protein